MEEDRISRTDSSLDGRSLPLLLVLDTNVPNDGHGDGDGDGDSDSDGDGGPDHLIQILLAYLEDTGVILPSSRHLA